MYARIITFRLEGLTDPEFRARATALAPAFAEWPGLLTKVWLADEASGTYGGLYLFADRESLDRSRDTDLHRSISANPALVDVVIRELDVLDEATAITSGGLVAAPARS